MNAGKAQDVIVSRSTVNDNGCWIWNGNVESFPYGRITYEGKSWLAHRLSFQAFNGNLFSDTVVDHLCSVKSCVNPEHLEQVTQGENVVRAAKLITSCPAGHEYTEENTGYYSIKKGKKNPSRYCKECNRLKYWKRKEIT